MKSAMLLILLMGLVSLFGDIVYEGARSVTGPFFYSLGATAAAVGLISGVGEFAGYGLRLLSGHLIDRTQRCWPLVFAGYGLILAVPFLAFAGRWEIAAVFIIVERIGKGLRTPARDVILSSASKSVGRGWAFGIHEALDQVGALAGPLVFTLVFALGRDYKMGFWILFIPAFLTLVMLSFARHRFPEPRRFEKTQEEKGKPIPKTFWLYLLFTCFAICGFANFQLISYHLRVLSVISEVRIPLLYAIAMAVDAVIALVIGKLYDRKGFITLISLPLISIPIAFLAFSTSAVAASIGVLLWGAAVGIQVTIMRASIADLVPLAKRGWAYGIFNTIFGFSWFMGSVVIGLLYEVSVTYVIIFAVILLIAAIPVFFIFKRQASILRVSLLGKKDPHKM